ncbi:MAG: response regulator, partial [Leptospiraceae bacterium]|nr:response regulator [Leptospiraceae bacterium]
YREGEFEEAEVALKEISLQNPADPIPLIYLNRCIEKKREIRQLQTGQKERVMVVDDNEVIIHLLELYLKKYDCEVFSETNGISALGSIDNFLPKIIFLDYNLPDINGIDVATIFREKITKLNLDTKIVLMTAEDRSLFQEYIQNSVVDEFLQKPFQEKDVRKILDRYLLEY